MIKEVFKSIVLELHPFSRAAVIKRSSHQEPGPSWPLGTQRRSMTRPLAAYIKDGHSFRVGGHAAGASVPRFETHLPPAGTLNAN